jgi:hypothetical protein
MNPQTVSMVRGEHAFVFRYDDTQLGRALLLNLLWQKECEEPEWWTVDDTVCIWQRIKYGDLQTRTAETVQAVEKRVNP